MLNRQLTRIESTGVSNYEIAQFAQTDLDEGVAMVSIIEDGVEKVKPGTGEAGEVFVGFSIMRPGNVNRLTEVYESDASSTGKVEFNHEINPADCRIEVMEADGTLTKLTVVLTGTPTAAQLLLDATGKIGTVEATNFGKVIKVSAAFVPTYIEAQAMYGQAPAGVQPSLSGATGVVAGFGQLVSTNLIDMAADWKIVNGKSPKLYLTTGGRVTTTQTDVLLDRITLNIVPSVGSGFATFRCL